MPPLVRRLVDLLPSGPVRLAHRVHEVVNPQPWPADLAAVELYKAERACRRGFLPYPPYLYGLHCAARTARAVGATAVTAVEFGVAGGNGLRALEDYADRVGARHRIRIVVAGLDSGVGLLEPSDPRDCGFAFHPGAFAGNPSKLRSVLRHAELIVGPVEDTVGPFMHRIETGELPPLGFVSHDLDVFTGTLAALDAMPQDPERMLPRVTMYFDDLTGYPCNDQVGEQAAITAFNERNRNRRIGGHEHLQDTLGGSARWQNWPKLMRVLNVFDHPGYGLPEQIETPDLRLRD